MLIITVLGIPADSSQKLIEKLREDLFLAVVSPIADLPEQENLLCYFPGDLFQSGLGEEMVIFVDGLEDAINTVPRRLEKARHSLAKSLVATVRRSFPETLSIRCLIRDFNPVHGYYLDEKKKKN